jgi:hypothetical protein
MPTEPHPVPDCGLDSTIREKRLGPSQLLTDLSIRNINGVTSVQYTVYSILISRLVGSKCMH